MIRPSPDDDIAPYAAYFGHGRSISPSAMAILFSISAGDGAIVAYCQTHMIFRLAIFLDFTFTVSGASSTIMPGVYISRVTALPMTCDFRAWPKNGYFGGLDMTRCGFGFIADGARVSLSLLCWPAPAAYMPPSHVVGHRATILPRSVRLAPAVLQIGGELHERAKHRHFAYRPLRPRF